MSKQCIIVGSGASIRQGLWDVPIKHLPVLKNIKNEVTFVCNWGYKWIRPTVEVFSDYRFYAIEKEKLDKQCPLIVSTKNDYYIREQTDSKQPKVNLGTNVILLKPAENFEPDTKTGKRSWYWGKDGWTKGLYGSQLSGILALSLAILVGFKEIYLLGMDACEIDGRTHFYQGDEEKTGLISWAGQDHCGIGKINGKYNTDNYNKIDDLNDFWYDPFKQELENGIKIFNVSINSKIDTFPKITYKEFYNRTKTKAIDCTDIARELIRSEIKTHAKDAICGS